VARRARGTSLSATLTALCAFGAMLTLAPPAHAHAVGLSRGTYTASEHGLRVELVLARGEVLATLPALDRNQDGALQPDEVTGAGVELSAWFTENLNVASLGHACEMQRGRAALGDQDGLEIELQYRCPDPGEPLAVSVRFLNQLGYGHRHLAEVVEGTKRREEVCFRGHDVFNVAPPAVRQGAPLGAPSSAGAFVRMGFEHILAGYDHVVFLLALILTAKTLRSLLGVVTAFTVGHSLSLALVTLGVFSPPPSLVESAIALSIAYVGIENLLQSQRDKSQSADRRWRITFPFGLVHGFGFAGALKEVAVPRADVAAALLAFNSGVEFAQVALLLAVLPLVLRLRRASWFGRRAVPALSIGVVAAGVVWFVARVQTAAREARDARPVPSEIRGTG